MAETAVTDTPTGVTATAVTFVGVVNPDGTPGRAYFEYGTTIAYGSQTGYIDVGSGTTDVPVSRQVTTLSASTTYEYRIVLDTSAVPPSSYGADLPARIGTSSGSIIHVTTLAQLNAAIAAVPVDGIISVDAAIDGGGGQLNVNCSGSSGAPVTITGSGDLHNFSQLYMTGSYLRILRLDIHSCALANLKVAGGNFVEIDGCEISYSGRQGILVSSPATNVQIWNNRIHDNGSTSNGNLDHGIYFSYARGDCVIANNLAYHNCAYNIQVYPDAPNVILTCNTVDDGIVHAQARGGIVIGSQGSPQTTNTVNVGMITTRAATYGISLYNPGGGNNTYDAIAYGNAFDYQTGPGMTYTNCIHAYPDFVDWDARNYHLNGGSPAIDAVQPARYGLVPPTDIDGTPRVTADAGAYAA